MREILEKAVNAILAQFTEHEFQAYCYTCDEPERTSGDLEEIM